MLENPDLSGPPLSVPATGFIRPDEATLTPPRQDEAGAAGDLPLSDGQADGTPPAADNGQADNPDLSSWWGEGLYPSDAAPSASDQPVAPAQEAAAAAPTYDGPS